MIRINIMLRLLATTISVVFFVRLNAQIIECINTDCGTIQANWELLEGHEAIVCEGEDFQLRGSESIPLDTIDEFHWYFLESNSRRVLFDTIMKDTSYVNFNYSVPDSVACELIPNNIPLTVTLVVTSLYCRDGRQSCNYKTSSLIVNLRPRARFSVSSEVCANTTFNPHNYSCHGDEFFWDFGDGDTSTLESPTHIYKKTGTYKITLTAKNGCGEVTTTREVKVVGLPEANFTYELDPQNACRPVMGTFINRSNEWSKINWVITPSGSEKWVLKDTTMTLQSDTIGILFKQAGEYDVTIVADNVCEMPDEYTEVIRIFEEPEIQLRTPAPFCDSANISFGDILVTDNGTIAKYVWTFDNGTQTKFIGREFPNITFNQSGTITLEITSPCGNITQSIPITVAKTDAITLSDGNPKRICENGDTIRLTAFPDGGPWSGLGEARNAITSRGLLNPDKLLPKPGNRYIFVYSIGAEGCPNQDSLEIEILNKAMVSLPDVPLVCDSLIYLPNPNYDGEISSYQWTFIGGSPLSSELAFPGSVIFYPSPNPNLAIVKATGVCGASSDTIEINVQVLQPLEISPDQTVCISDSILQLEANLGPGRWLGGPEIDPLSGEVKLYQVNSGTVSTIRSYIYIYQEDTDCEQSDTVQVEIIDLGQVVQAGPDEETCAGSRFYTLTGASPANGYWIGEAVNTQSGVIDLTRLEPDRDYEYKYCLESTRVAACEACDSRIFRINSNPVASFSVDNVACVKDSVELENNSTNASWYSWNFGDSPDKIQDANPKHPYLWKDTFTIELITESERGGCKDTTTRNIYITTPPIANFTLDSREGCAPFTLGITNHSSGDSIALVWYINEETISGSHPGSIVFDSLTDDRVFPIILAATNLCGEVRHQDSVLVRAYPIADFGINVDEGCSPLLTNFSNTTTGMPDELYWNMGNDSNYMEINPPDQLYTTTQNKVSVYTVTLRAKNECGEGIISKDITVFPPDVEAFIEMDTLQGCSPLTFKPESFSTPGAEVSWRFISPDGTFGGSEKEKPEITFSKPGLHTIVLYASRCGIATDTAYVDVLPAPELGFVSHPQVCPGQPIPFENTSIGISGSFWSFGDSTFSVETSPIHQFDSAGIYTIRLTAYSLINNCPATFVDVVEVVNPPKADFIPNITVGCNPSDIHFKNLSTGIGPLSYIWSFGDNTKSNQENPLHRFEKPGSYDVELITVYNEFCRDTLFMHNAIQVFPSPIADFNYEADELPNLIGEVQFFNLSSNADHFLWDLGDSTQTTEIDPFHEYNINRSITATLYAYQDNDGFFTCVDSIQKQIEPEWITTFFTPNAFSPEYGPEEVRYFQPKGIGLEKYQINVHSPNGQLVWYSTTLENSSPKEAWNGHLNNNGSPLPQGSYVWSVKITFVNGEKRAETGTVTILR